MIKELITKILHRIAKVFFLPLRKPSVEINTSYSKEISVIEKIYSEPLYWHGTGRYHYDEKGDIQDVLKGIVKEGGIIPLVKDPWLKSRNDYRYTISLANVRMYASVYAIIHQDENEPVRYLYGSRFIWSILIGLTNLIHSPYDVTKHAFIFTKNKLEKQLIGFQSKVRKEKSIKHFGNFLFQLVYMPFIRSDIRDNYSIMIGIKRKNLEFIELSSGFSYFEARTQDPILLKDISHLEVPASRVAETETLLRNHNINTPVISIESAELYAKNKITLRNLLTPPPIHLLSEVSGSSIAIPFFDVIDGFENSFSKFDKYHNFAHALRCYFYAGILMRAHNNANKKVVCVAALLHDIGKRGALSAFRHGERSAEWIRKNIGGYKLELSKDEISDICDLCVEHCKDDSEDMPIELKILKDADSLDRWRLPISKTNQKYLRLDISVSIQRIIKDFVNHYNLQYPKMTDMEKLEKTASDFGINIE